MFAINLNICIYPLAKNEADKSESLPLMAKYALAQNGMHKTHRTTTITQFFIYYKNGQYKF